MSYRSRERVARILAHKEADRVPFDCLGCLYPEVRELLDGMDLSPDQRQCYTEGDFAYVQFRLEQGSARFEPYLPDLPPGAQVSEWGVGKLPAKSADGHAAGSRLYHPLAHVDTVEGLARFPFPDVTAPGCH